ncbi:MAG: hypothetical protein AABY22_09870 [Nanoarchaeota archaeon]
MKKTCKYCQEIYNSKRKDNVTCGKPICKKQYQKQYYLKNKEKENEKSH